MSTNRNRVIGGFEYAVERGQTATKSAAKQTVNDFAGSVKGQVTGSQNQVPTGAGSGTNENANAGAAQQQPPSDQGTGESNALPNQQNQQMTDAQRVEFLRNLYGKSDNNAKANDGKAPQKGSGPVAQALGVPQKDPNEGKSPEEIAKIEVLRRQLHSDYYQNLVNRPKPKEEPVAEKMEKEKQMEALVEQKKEQEKPGPLQNVKQGTGEAVVGVSG